MTDDVPAAATRYRHPADWAIDLPPLSMPAMFEAAVARDPDAPLIDFLGRTYSYRETLDGVRGVARGLQALGLGPGTRVGLFLPNVPHYVAAYFGIMLAGATAVNFSPLYSVEELAGQVEDSGTRLLFTLSAAALLPTALEVLERSSLERLVVGSVAGVLPRARSLLYRLFKRREASRRPDDPRITAFSALIANDRRPEPVVIDPVRDVALLQYTGGTTGTPKGAMLTHQNLTANARQVNAIDPHPEAPDRILGVLPLFHVFANCCVLNRTVVNGGEMVLLPRFDAGQALAAIGRRRITSVPGVPTMYQALLDHPRLARTDFGSLRACISGGAPLPAELKTRFQAATGARLIEGYGLTETAGVVSSNPYEGQDRPGTIGQPIPATRVRLADKEDAHRPAAPGAPGELLVAGPQVMRGYWNRPEADAEVFVGEWLRTGDVATIDADGFIAIVDRLKDMIAVGGFKVFPSSIEAVLYRHPAVRDALVIGMPDAYRRRRSRPTTGTRRAPTAAASDRARFWRARETRSRRWSKAPSTTGSSSRRGALRRTTSCSRASRGRATASSPQRWSTRPYSARRRRSPRTVAARVAILPVATDGKLAMGTLRAALEADARPALVSIQAANSETGVLQDLGAIARLVRGHPGCAFHSDAAQAVGRIDLALGGGDGPDLITLSAHKLHGPMGVGAVVIADEADTTLLPLIHGGGQEGGARSGTEAVSLVAGFAAACREWRDDGDERRRRLSALRSLLEGALARIEGATVNGATAPRAPHVSSVTFGGMDAMSLVAALDARGVAVSQGSACSSRRPEPSHVLRAMGLGEADAFATIRFSLSALNDVDDAATAVRIVADVVETARRAR